MEFCKSMEYDAYMSDEKKIQFYVIIPVFRTEKYIGACIESVLNQTYGKYKIVIVDDGSPDKAGVICDEYALKHSCISVIHQQNKGQAAARRAGINHVLHEFDTENAYFVFLDSDDSLKSYALLTIKNTIQTYDCDLVIYGLERVHNGAVIDSDQEPFFAGIITDKRVLYKKVFCNSTYNSLCKKAIKCDLLEEGNITFSHVIRGEDLLESLSALKNSKKTVFLSDALYEYTINPQSVTQNITYQTYRIDSTAYTKVWEFLQDECVFTPNDETEYWNFCRKLLWDEVKMVALFRTDLINIKCLLEKIRYDVFYEKVLNNAPKLGVLMWLKYCQYVKIILYVRVRNYFGRLYRYLKKRIKI